MGSDKFTLVLASQSPRRKQFLSWLNIPFEIKTADLDEISHLENPSDIAKDLASQKAHAVWEKCQDGKKYFLMASDTIVVLDGVLYAKPQDKEDARFILSKLSGRTHQVMTGVTFLFKDEQGKMKEHSFYDLTDVTFSEITDDLMNDYLETGDSMDKAGAYGIQGPSLTFISRVEGSYSNVVGFPLDKIIVELKKLFGNDWRTKFNA